MALIPCPECKKKVSDAASSCPKCGVELTPERLAVARKKQGEARRAGGIACLVVIAVAIVVSQFGQGRRDAPALYSVKTAHEVLIKDALRDPESASFAEHAIAETFTMDKVKWIAMTSSVTGANLLGGRQRKFAVTAVRWVLSGREWKPEFSTKGRAIEVERPNLLTINYVMASAEWPRDDVTKMLRTDPESAGNTQ